ncbi:Rad17-domain-containing protein [Lichtheimia hyalospora FSU 10163]|nr:Rad17-domain-containing protein [Lichtheimia hyalospora FSU 10163]
MSSIMQEQLIEQFHQLLVLSGPAGSGKSTMMKLLAEEDNIPIVEWETILDRYNEPEYQSSISKLERFLHDATLYSSLDHQKHDNKSRRRQIILLDDLPYLGNDALQSRFHQLLFNYLSSTEPFLIVLIVTEATMPIEGRRNDTQLTNLRDLIPQHITSHPGCHIVEFNPITLSAMNRTLTRIYDLEKNTTTPVSLTKDTISRIAESSRGDIRNAINNLQYYCIPSTSRSRDNTKRRRTDIQVSESREDPLSLFHAVGKVLHAKRSPDGKLESLPEIILDRLADWHQLTPYIYEHYPNFFTHIEDASKAIHWMCEGDYLSSLDDWRDHTGDEYEALIAMYGTMGQAKHERLKSQGIVGFGRPQYLDAVYQQRTKEPSIGLWNRGAALLEPSSSIEDVDDPIEEFMSDEDDFDQVFGDGTDLADLDV